MAVTVNQKTERALYLSQVEKIANSHTLHNADSLRKLLRYLADHALEHPGTPLKEYQIATEVFGRPADFDPALDSTIRVQAGRLRLKLAEYYASEGGDDAIQVEMPKGTYLISFHHRTPESSKTHAPSPGSHDLPLQEVKAGRSTRVWAIAVATLSILLLAAIVVIGSLLATRQKATASASEPVPRVLETFWRPFVSDPEEPWVIFS